MGCNRWSSNTRVLKKGTLEKVTELRQNIMNLNIKDADIGQLQRIESLNKQLMHSLNVVIENYPELKANDIYLKMMAEIEEQNENVGAAITIYNRNVELKFCILGALTYYKNSQGCGCTCLKLIK